MRFGKTVIWILAITAVVYLRNYILSDAVLDRLAMPYRMIKLTTMQPERSIAMPVQGVSKTRVANTWGAPRGSDRKHEGQDIFAKRGTPVVAATHGIVSSIRDGGLGGKSVFVLGPGGWVYYYAHLDRHAEGLKTGDIVQVGTVLGYVGNTGNARGTPPHLHFGIYTAKGAVNPLPFIDRPPDDVQTEGD